MMKSVIVLGWDFDSKPAYNKKCLKRKMKC